MENDAPFVPEDARQSRRGKLMGKLLGRERRATNEESSRDLNDFLHGPSDKLGVSHPGPPVLAKLDISSATRYPTATALNTSQRSLPLRPSSRSPRPGNKKGLMVRFVDTFPEIIGEGGDECEIAVIEIGKMRRTKAVREAPKPALVTEPATKLHVPYQTQGGGPMQPPPVQRIQASYTPAAAVSEPIVPAGVNAPAKFLDSPVISQDEKRKSFIEIHQAEQRVAEGLAFAEARRSASVSSQHDWEERRHSPAVALQMQDSPSSRPPGRENSPDYRIKRPAALEQSPASVHSTTSSLNQSYSLRQAARAVGLTSSSGSPQKASQNLQDVVVAAGDDALNAFVTRTRHLHELFRLQAETVLPLSMCTVQDLARAGSWWFLTGRMALELLIRSRPTSPQEQRQADMNIQQAYADLAKGYWLMEEVLPEVRSRKASGFDIEAGEVHQMLVSQLRKLCMSMKRNGFLPPEEAFLPQAIDKTVWLEYPTVSQDVIMLLWGSWGSSLTQPDRSVSGMDIADAFPLGDTARYFSYGRVNADVYLMEQDRQAEGLYFPCLLSTVRPQKQTGLEFVLASQDGAIQLRIPGSKNAGPTWDSVKWRSETFTLDILMPRGFVLAVRLGPADYSLLWNMYDFGAKVHATLFPRKDEQVVFRSTLRAFQYFDSDPQSRQFPKDPVPNCEVAMFERILRESAVTGPRSYHMGYRLSVVTGPRTRTLSGVNHAFMPQMPVQFGFLRGEQNDPALLLKFDNGRAKGSMVLSFDDEKERMRLHNLLIGTELHHDELVCSEAPLTAFTISRQLEDSDGVKCIQKLPWQRARIINDDHGGEEPQTVLSDRLRIVLEFKHGSLTDRVNVAPGEFKVRLEPQMQQSLMIFRQPQNDMTVALSEAQTPRDLTRELAETLQLVQQSATIRTYHFTSSRELHDFQAALTGFKVLFDGIAATFAISRRRMVVPIHKKWEAGATRIQIVRQEHSKVTQLLAFFDDFAHGQCMNFVLKGTDVFESFNRAGKAGVKLDDAKFPLPRTADVEGDGGKEDPEAAFVCLDLPDLPGEHDDITILFDDPGDRDALLACLPAPVKGSRLSKIRGL